MYPSMNDEIVDDIRTNKEYLTPNFIIDRHITYDDIASDAVSMFVNLPTINNSIVIEHKIDPLVSLFTSSSSNMI